MSAEEVASSISGGDYRDDFDDESGAASPSRYEDEGFESPGSAVAGGTGGEGKAQEVEEEEETAAADAESKGGDGDKPQRRRRIRKVRRRRKKKKKKKKKTVQRPASGDDYYDEDDRGTFSDGGSYAVYMDGESMYREDEDDETVDRYVATRRESARIMSKRFMERNEVKARIMRERQRTQKRLLQSKKRKEAQWRRKMERSPFMVDLIAENERIDEENRVRIEEETRREHLLRTRKEKIKNEIVLKALSEVSDLDALRREKRLIADEEKRLKALLIMEKANAHTKADLMAAQRAERQRKQVQAQYRRARLREETQMRRHLETELLREKLNAPPEEAFTEFSKTLG